VSPRSPSSSGARPAAGTRLLALAALRVVALTVAPGVVGALAGGVLTGSAAPSAFADPGVAVRWGLPVARVVGDLAASLTIGLLLLAAVVLWPARAEAPRGSRRASPTALASACVAGVVWALAAAARLVLGYAAGTGQSLAEPTLGTQLVSYLTQVQAGRWAAAAVAGAALVATLAAGIRGARAAGALVLPAAAALGAQILSDAAGTPGRSAASIAVLWLHAVTAAVVVGVLGGLLLLAAASPQHRLIGARPPRPPALPVSAAPEVPAVRAVPAVLAVLGASGVVVAWAHPAGVPAGPAFWTLLVVKAVALVALAAAAFPLWRRSHRAPPGGSSAGPALGAAAALAAGALAVGLGVALALAA
jgi:hypothetical protein